MATDPQAVTKLSRGELLDGKTMIAAGWVYRYMEPHHWLPEAAWEAFLSIIGFSNYRILELTKAAAVDGGIWKRGQFLISPEGMRRLLEHAKKPGP